ncbi:MAG: PDZ domain-containing protein [Candidatus Sungbacteria bacterium]|nr:PDZ domain-containing protein [Candidatus Sungbacteria bacterium]
MNWFLIVFVGVLMLGATAVSAFAWQKEADAVGEIFKIIEENSLDPVDLTRCRYDMLKSLTKESLPAIDPVSKTASDKEFVCLDRFSGFMTPDEYREMTTEMAGAFAGVGMELSEKDGAIVVSPIEGTPAEKAGVKAGDIVVKVRQENETEWTPIKDMQTAAKLMRGKKGTVVHITIERAGKPFEISITRDVIKVSSVVVKTLPGNVGYVRLRIFGDNSADEVEAALRSFSPLGPRPEIVFDLRDNLGGEMYAALEILYMLDKNPDDTMLTIRFNKNRKPEIHTIRNSYGKYRDVGTGAVKDAGEFAHYKIVLLVNENSASASELVAGALQDRGYTVVGKTSFGKGVGQFVVQLSDGSGFRITAFEFCVGNSKTCLHKKGVTPAIEVADSRKSAKDTAMANDAQLQKALEVLKNIP